MSDLPLVVFGLAVELDPSRGRAVEVSQREGLGVPKRGVPLFLHSWLTTHFVNPKRWLAQVVAIVGFPRTTPLPEVTVTQLLALP